MRTSTSGQGRPKGIPNRKTYEFLQQVLGSGKSPLEILVEFSREKPPTAPAKLKASADDMAKTEHDRAVREWVADMAAWKARVTDAAKAAAPYCHPRLQASVNPADWDKPPVQKVEVSFV